MAASKGTERHGGMPWERILGAVSMALVLGLLNGLVQFPLWGVLPMTAVVWLTATWALARQEDGLQRLKKDGLLFLPAVAAGLWFGWGVGFLLVL